MLSLFGMTKGEKRCGLQGSGGHVAGDEAGYYHLTEMVAKRSRSNRSEETAVLRDPSHSNPYHITSQEMTPSLGIENLRPICQQAQSTGR